MASRKLDPIHPGEVLASEFLEPLGLSQYRVAQDMSVPPRRIIDSIAPEPRRQATHTLLDFQSEVAP